MEAIKGGQRANPLLEKIRHDVQNDKHVDLYLSEDKVLGFNRLCVPEMRSSNKFCIKLLTHRTQCTQASTTKMYRNLRNYFWWPYMKNDVVLYIAKCLTCQPLKAKHQKPIELLQ